VGLADGKWEGTWTSCLPCDQSDLSFHTRNVENYHIQNASFCTFLLIWQCCIIGGPGTDLLFSTVPLCLHGFRERTFQTLILLKRYQECGLKQNDFCGNCGDGRVMAAKWWKPIDCTLCVVEKNM